MARLHLSLGAQGPHFAEMPACFQWQSGLLENRDGRCHRKWQRVDREPACQRKVRRLDSVMCRKGAERYPSSPAKCVIPTASKSSAALETRCCKIFGLSSEKSTGQRIVLTDGPGWDLVARVIMTEDMGGWG